MPDLIQVTTLSPEELHDLAGQLHKRFSPLWERVRWRRKHLHNDKSVDPAMPDHLNNTQKFQSDALRRVSNRLRARLTENEFTIKVEPTGRDTPTARVKANKLEQVFTVGMEILQERQGLDIQGELSDGQVNDCFGMLHWRMADHIWPPVPDYEYADELPDDPDEAARYEEAEDDDKKKGKYRETDAALQERVTGQRVIAGYPWYVEVVDPVGLAFVQDKSLRGGFATVMVVSDVGRLDYVKTVRGELGEEAVSVNQANKDIPIYGETAAPSFDLPSGDGWGDRVRLYQFWTRDEFYEVVAGTSMGAEFSETMDGGEWKLVKSCTHPYGMPPFALARANGTKSADPVWAYEPALEGMYRLKPAYDRLVTLMQIIAEQIAVPYYYLRRVGSGEPMLAEDGNILKMTRDSAMAERIPDGYTIEKLEFEMNPALVQAWDMLRQEFNDAAPPAGQSEISASTQPWAIRLQQAEASVEPGRLLAASSNAMNTMFRNMAQIMSLSPDAGGFPDEVVVMGQLKGKNAKEKISVAAEDIKTLMISTSISNTSSAEKITLVEHGRALLNDPLVPLTPEKFVEEFMGIPNPDEVVANYEAWRVFNDYLREGLIAQELRRAYGNRIVLGQDGQFVGPAGAPLTPEQVFAANGMQPPVPPAPMMQAPGAGTGLVTGAIQQQAIPDMGPIAPPGAIPLNGLMG